MRIPKQKGFTIVELSIVIVVIGILATITIVGFSGVQERARNVARINAVHEYYDILRITLEDTSPNELIAAMDHTDGWDRACLGTDYPNVGGDSRPDCGAVNNIPYVSESTAFNSILGTEASLPSMSAYPKVVATDGNVEYGPYVDVLWVDGQYMIAIEYLLEGEDQECSLKPLIYYTAGYDTDYTLEPSADPRNTISWDGVTECIIAAVKKVY